jgi:transposase
MLWAEYTKDHQALKLHLCFELNRMIPVDFQLGNGNSSEREALLKMAAAGVTYIADRGYMSFQLCRDLVEKHAFFVFRACSTSVGDSFVTCFKLIKLIY